jgi:murein DD-endopeptidase MepM/ murein hydrolase activator NlpD
MSHQSHHHHSHHHQHSGNLHPSHTATGVPHPALTTPSPSAPATPRILPVGPVTPSAVFFDPTYKSSQSRQHLGVDYPAPVNTGVSSPFGGVVMANTLNQGYMIGCLTFRDDYGLYHVFGHIRSNLSANSRVKAGDVVGYIVSSPGYGPHVHWGTRTSPVNTATYEPYKRGSNPGQGDWGWGRCPASSTMAQASLQGWRSPI